MKKGFVVKGMAVTLAAVMLTGCGAMSAEDYQDAMEDAFKDYYEALSDLGNMMYEDEDDFDNGEAKKTVNEAKAALNDMKKLSPPKEIKDEHKDLCKYVDILIEMTDLTYDYTVAYVNDDDDKMEKLEEKVEKLQEKAEDYTDALEDMEDKL